MPSSMLRFASTAMVSGAACSAPIASPRSSSSHRVCAARVSSAARTAKMSRISRVSRLRTESRPRAPGATSPSCWSWRSASRSVPRLMLSISDRSVSTRCLPGGSFPVVTAILALFIPLLTGTGGNTGNQAATTVTRALALALGDVRIRDMGKVVLRELRVGAALGLLLGSLGCLMAASFYGAAVGLVMGLTLASVCTMAATVGGAMPLIGKSLKVDPVVFSNPFISTFCDASSLVMYFLIARAILNL